MSIRIEIELTSSAPDGSWTWRAAGAREPRGVLDGSILPAGAAVGDQLRVETEHDMDGIRVLSVVPSKEKGTRSGLLELLPSEEKFEPVVQHRVPGGRGDGPRGPRRDRPDGDRRDRRDRPRGPGGPGGPGDRPGGDRDRGDRGRGGADRGDRRDPPRGDGEDRRRQRPHFTPPPEVPQRPKPKRLRPGKQHRTEVLASTPEEQRPVAELALQGIAAVRQRLREDNARLRAEGKPEMPEAAVMRMAEDVLPRLRVADWLDRAEAAQRQMEHLDLRDLRSVVAASDDPVVARDESTRELAASLRAALVTKQEEELTLWLADVEAALDVGRVVRALRLSSVPPKAGVPFPGALATRLAEATTASLLPTDGPDRWAAVLEAVAFSPVRSLVLPAAPAEAKSDELLATVKRLGPLLPQVAALFGVEVPANAPVPKPLRPNTRRPEAKKQAPRPEKAPAPRSGDDTRPIPAPPSRSAPMPVPADDASPPTGDASPPSSGDDTQPIPTPDAGDVAADHAADPGSTPVAGDDAVEAPEPAPAAADVPIEAEVDAATPAAEVAGEVFADAAPSAPEVAEEHVAEPAGPVVDTPIEPEVVESAPDVEVAEPAPAAVDEPVVGGADVEAEVATPAAEVAGEVFADATPSASDVADDDPRPD